MEQEGRLANLRSLSRGLRRAFLFYSLVLVTGYLFFGKGFAYFGFRPLYIAEIGLLLGGLAIVAALLGDGSVRSVPWRHPITLSFALFVIWQVGRTVPFLGQFGLMAARDAMVWGYAGFAILAYLLLGHDEVDWIVQEYFPKLARVYLLWLPLAFFFVKLHPLEIFYPGSPVPVLWLKSGDVGVHLVGIAGFFLLLRDANEKRTSLREWGWWVLWAAGWAMFTASNRAGMFSTLLGIAGIAVLRPRSKWWRPLISMGLVLGVLYVTALRIPISDHEELSFRQFRVNLATSVEPFLSERETEAMPTGDEEERNTPVEDDGEQTSPQSGEGGVGTGALRGTIRWRLDWWKKIVNETVFGPHFWLGRGYGYNLAKDGDIDLSRDPDLRSPHNVFITILGHAGVPGLLLWIIFLSVFLVAMLREAVTGDGHWRERRYAVWLIPYWSAFVFNASFDVFLEGPMGGVPYWLLVGLGAVLLNSKKKWAQRQERRSDSR